MPTEYGDFRMVGYRDVLDGLVHFALVKGNIQAEEPTLVRVHMQNCVCDTIGSLRPESGWPIADVLRRIEEAGSGVALILRQPEDNNSVIKMMQDYQTRDKGVDLHKPEVSEDLRTYGIGAQILKDIGVQRMRVMSSPKKMHALSGFGLEVVEYVQGDA